MPATKKILIIEDEKTLADALSIKLARLGYRIQVAIDGEDGIKLITTEKFDLILLDLIMPKIDGFGVLAALKTNKIVTPVIILTNLSQENDLRRTKEFGAVGFFIKSNTSIATIVEQVVHVLK